LLTILPAIIDSQATSKVLTNKTTSYTHVVVWL